MTESYTLQLTDEQIKAAYFASQEKEMTDDNLAAFRRMCKRFDVPQEATYEQAKQWIIDALGGI